MEGQRTHRSNSTPPRGARILSLSGGGVRGLLQARYLQRLERKLSAPVRDHVDLFAGTSTGALTAGLLAAGVSASHVFNLFKEAAIEVFSPRPFAFFRAGGRYDPARLNQLVQEAVGTITLGQLPKPLMVTTSAVDTYAAKLFSSATDPDVTLLDAIMASSAAPTYFPPRRIIGDSRGFYDGGLWANDPLDAAITWVQVHQGVQPQNVRALSIGTGTVTKGATPSDLEHLPYLSMRTAKTVWDLTTTLQASGAGMSAESRIGSEAIVRVNPTLPRWVPLDDAATALELMPGLADAAFEESQEAAAKVLEPFTQDLRTPKLVEAYTQETAPKQYALPLLLERASKFHFLARSGVTLFAAYEAQLSDAVRRGCDLRFITTDPQSPGFASHDDTEMHLQNLSKTKVHLRRLRGIESGRVTCRLTPFPLTASVIYLEDDLTKQELLIVQLYFAVSRVGRDRPLLFLYPGDDLYQPYKDELDRLWNQGSSWSLED